MRTRPLAAALTALALLATACGGGEASTGTTEPDTAPGTDQQGIDTASPVEQEDADAPPEGDAPITVEAANGAIELDAPAEDVVALEWTYVEDLLAAGVQPVGAADVAGYEQWVDVQPALDASVTDVGDRQEPSLESIAALDPDLIIGVQFRHEPILDQLEAIAPTVLFNPYPELDAGVSQFEEMTQTFTTIAAAVGRSEQAETVLDQMQATFDEVGVELAAAQLDTQRFALAQGFTAEEAATIRMFTSNAMAVEIIENLGLENAWPGEPDPFGFNTVDIEALTQVGDAHFLYVAQEEDNIFTGALADNPIWQDLEFVQQERIHPLGGDTWLFGGPLSAEVLARDVAEVLTAE